LSGRGNSSWTNRSRFNGNGGRSNFGGSRFSGGRFQNALLSRFGNRGLGGARGYGYGRGRFGYGGFHHGWGYGYGFNHFGYGYGGWGFDPWWNDLWFLGDLFGLALDFGRFAIAPAWSIAGAGLLETGLQALSSIGDSNDDGGYGNYGYDNDGYNDYDNGPQYDSFQYDDGNRFYATSAVSTYPALCGRYYSDENPGCRQEY